MPITLMIIFRSLYRNFQQLTETLIVILSVLFALVAVCNREPETTKYARVDVWNKQSSKSATLISGELNPEP